MQERLQEPLSIKVTLHARHGDEVLAALRNSGRSLKRTQLSLIVTSWDESVSVRHQRVAAITDEKVGDDNVAIDQWETDGGTVHE